MDATGVFLLLYFAGIAVVAITGACVIALFYTYWQAKECVRIRGELRGLRTKLKERRRQLQKLVVEIEDAGAKLAETEKRLDEEKAATQFAGNVVPAA